MNSHLSEEQISAWLAGERSAEAKAHLAACGQCAAEVERTAGTLALFRESSMKCAEYWEARPVVRKRSRGWRWVIAAPVLVALVLAAVMARRPAPAPVRPPETGFVRIPYVVPPAPYERTAIVHMNVPVAALVAAGFRMNEPASATVPADVLVGQDNRPLAVRFQE
ncbi:MAG TPA: hypothetical protein VHC90_19580 [Bryobacteraceae bacterium]|nr:hypothetical protein [Bryobacteraceae bacterium]